MLNVTALMGRLVADPELRHTASDTAVTTCTLAVESGWGEHKRTDFIDVVAWRQTAEFICKYFTKGRMMAVTGEIQTRAYEDRQGNKRKAFEVKAREVSFGDSRRDDSEAPTGQKPAAFHEPEPPQAFSQPEYGQEVLADNDLPF